MAFQKPIINKISTDIKGLTIYLRTIKKWGKSTLFRDLILAKYNDPTRGLSIGCGKEKGEKLLDNLNITRIHTYKDAIELKEWLITEKGKEHNIEIISFDTIDELIPMFETETIRISNIENPTKKTKTINGAMGGYQEGQRYTAELVKKYMDELHEAGFGIFAIAHTKFKNIKEKGGLEEDGYMQLTSNLVSAYESAFGDIFDVTLTGVIDRDIDEKEVKVGNETKKKRYATDSIRKLYFRGTPLIDAGGRFADGAVPEYMVFDKPNMASEFIKVIEEGMEKSKTTFSGKLYIPVKEEPKTETSKPTIKETHPDDEYIDEEHDEDIDNIDELEETTVEIDLVETVKELYKKCKDKKLKAEIKEVIAQHGKVADVPTDQLQEIYNKLQ